MLDDVWLDLGRAVQSRRAEWFLRRAIAHGTAATIFVIWFRTLLRKGLRPIIDKRFDRVSAARAMLHVESHHSLGKVVVSI